MCPSSIARDVYKLIKINERSKELRREKYEKIKELFKLVRECEKGDKAFNLNVGEVYETYHKVEEVYEETKKLEQEHTDLHEKMRELFRKKYNNYEEEILFVFNNSADEMRYSYIRALNEINDTFSKYCTLRPSEIGDLWGEDRIYDIFHKALKEEREITKEVVDRPNKEVKRILDELDEENIKINNMLKLHEKELEKTKKELSFQFMSLKMLRYIRRRMEEIDAFKGEIKEALRKEYKAFKAYEKVYNEGFNEMEEEVAFETFKRAFEDIKEPCKKLFDQPMSNVDSLFQAFEEFCRVRESCVKKLGSILNLISEIKKFIIANLVFEVIIVQIQADLCFSDHDKLYYARNDSYSDNADVLYEKVVPMENSYDGKGIQRCAPSKETDDYLREKLDRFPITADLISELIRKIKGIVMDNLHCEYIVGNVDGVLLGTYEGCCPVKAYDCTFSDNTDNKLLDVLEEIPDKLVQQEVMEVKVATVMLYEEWKKWAKVHNAFFSCFSI